MRRHRHARAAPPEAGSSCSSYIRMPVWPAASTMADVVSLAASYWTWSRCPTRSADTASSPASGFNRRSRMTTSSSTVHALDAKDGFRMNRRRPGVPPQQVPGPGLRPGHQRVGRRPPGRGVEPARGRRGAGHREGPPRCASARWCRWRAGGSASGLGNAVDLDGLVDDIGPDVMRLLSLVSSIDQSPTIDLDKVRAESRESPAFYIQYAYARIHSLGRFGAEKGVEPGRLDAADLSLLTHEREARRAAHAVGVPRRRPPRHRRAGAPQGHRLGARELADRFHGFYPTATSSIPTSRPSSPRPACGSSSRRGWAWPSASTCSACRAPSRCARFPRPEAGGENRRSGW